MSSRITRALAGLALAFACSTTHANLIDFDSLLAGSPVSVIDGVSFSAEAPGYGPLNLIVSDIFDAASGNNYLGTSDTFDEVFLALDSISLTFANPITRLAVNFISTPWPPEAAFGIETDLGSGVSGLVPDSLLGDGGEVYGVSFESLTPFSSARLVGLLDGVHSFNIDDISFTPAGPVQAPEPAAAWLLLSGLAGLAWKRRRQRR